MTAFTVADHLADRLAELSSDNVFGRRSTTDKVLRTCGRCSPSKPGSV
jgi:hypothetical protein